MEQVTLLRAPALQASNPDLNATLREGEGRTVAGSRGITSHVLAVAEVALAAAFGGRGFDD